jgi:hypothetical protein
MKRFMLVSILLILSIITLKAQELDAVVSINYDQLSAGAKDKLVNYKNQVQDYLNNTKFTGQTWDGDRIRCSFNIFFTAASGDIQYTAQLVVASQRPIEGVVTNSLMLTIMDNKWTFEYEKNQSMTFNPIDFNSLLSFLDYYAYIIIGFDMDSYYRLGGSDYFSRALEIAVRGGASKFSESWQSESSSYNKRVFVDNLLNAKYQQLRADVFDYHYNGIDLLNDPKNREFAMNNIVKLITNLYKVKDQIDPRSVYLKVFFDAKAGEIANCVKSHPDKGNIINMLKRLDPAHTTKYEEALNNN